MDPFVSFSFFNVSPLPHMLFSLFFFFSHPTSQICHLFRFSFCLSIPPKPNPNSINQSQNCFLTPIPLSEISARLLPFPPGNHIGLLQMRIWESNVRYLESTHGFRMGNLDSLTAFDNALEKFDCISGFSFSFC